MRMASRYIRDRNADRRMASRYIRDRDVNRRMESPYIRDRNADRRMESPYKRDRNADKRLVTYEAGMLTGVWILVTCAILYFCSQWAQNTHFPVQNSRAGKPNPRRSASCLNPPLEFPGMFHTRRLTCQLFPNWYTSSIFDGDFTNVLRVFISTTCMLKTFNRRLPRSGLSKTLESLFSTRQCHRKLF